MLVGTGAGIAPARQRGPPRSRARPTELSVATASAPQYSRLMVDQAPLVPRVIVGTVNLGRGSVQEDVSKIVVDELQAAHLAFIRSVTIAREKRYIQQLIMNVSNSNEADAIILVGGVGLGPRDYTCEAVDSLADRRIEGFGEAFRRLLSESLSSGASALLQRATAGVYNKSIVFGLPRKPEAVRLAMRMLVIPTIAEAVRIAAQ
jgi:molybdopterin adenylyltransferase